MREALKGEIESSLAARVSNVRAVAGGDINEAFAVALDDGRHVFVKTRENAPSDTYRREAEGLAFLRQAGALEVAEVIAVGDAFLALTWIASAARARDFDERLGRGLAALHRHHPCTFGLAHDNYVGALPQPNAARPTFAAFYEELRLRPLVSRASALGLLDAGAARDFELLYRRLGDLLGPREPPARLHGDLWSGNVLAGEHGEPVLIDPAVYGGHREIDLAMLQLFGSPSARFFAAYDEVYPRAADSRERVPLMQLYPLLVHLCLFGSSYAAQLLRALRTYL
jgi:fructosamine-3-kinase